MSLLVYESQLTINCFIHTNKWYYHIQSSFNSLSAVASVVKFQSVQCHPVLTYIFNYWHSGTLAWVPESPNVRN